MEEGAGRQQSEEKGTGRVGAQGLVAWRRGVISTGGRSPVKQQIVLILISQGQTNYAYQKAKLHNRVSLSPSLLFC